MTLQELMDQSWQIAEEHGFHGPQTPWTFLGNLHCEVSEAWEEIRAGRKPTEIYFEPKGDNAHSQRPDKPVGFPIELADIAIRLADTAKHLGIDLEAAIKMKMEYNKNRPFMHGGKVI